MLVASAVVLAERVRAVLTLAQPPCSQVVPVVLLIQITSLPKGLCWVVQLASPRSVVVLSLSTDLADAMDLLQNFACHEVIVHHTMAVVC